MLTHSPISSYSLHPTLCNANTLTHVITPTAHHTCQCHHTTSAMLTCSPTPLCCSTTAQHALQCHHIHLNQMHVLQYCLYQHPALHHILQYHTHQHHTLHHIMQYHTHQHHALHHITLALNCILQCHTPSSPYVISINWCMKSLVGGLL